MGNAGRGNMPQIDLENDFRSIQLARYFTLAAKKDFTTSEEAEIINRLITTAYTKFIEPVRKKLLNMNTKERLRYFNNVDIDFPLYPDRDNGLGDIEFDTDDEDLGFDEEKEMEELLDRLEVDDIEEPDGDYIFDGIPEEEREDVVMLMIAFPALREAGFPIDIFLGGAKHPDLSDKQRQQIDWGLQLAYKIADIERTKSTAKRKKLIDDLRTFAGFFLPEEKIDSVIKEMRITYRKGME
jgi:hypothetical protein